eukprot:11404389-Heterocapsa_arctica.AAC.1
MPGLRSPENCFTFTWRGWLSWWKLPPLEVAAIRVVAEVGFADSADVLSLDDVSAHRDVRSFCELTLPLRLVDSVAVQ